MFRKISANMTLISHRFPISLLPGSYKYRKKRNRNNLLETHNRKCYSSITKQYLFSLNYTPRMLKRPLLFLEGAYLFANHTIPYPILRSTVASASILSSSPRPGPMNFEFILLTITHNP